MATYIPRGTAGPLPTAPSFSLPGLSAPKAPAPRFGMAGVPGGLRIQRGGAKAPKVRNYGAPTRRISPVKAPAKLTTTSRPHAGAGQTVNPPRPAQTTPLQRNTGAPRSVPRPARRTSQTSYPVVPGRAPLADQEQQYVDASVNPQLAALDRLAAFQQQQQTTATNAFQGLTNQYLQTLNKEPAQVQSDYNTGIQQQLAAAQLSSNALAAANPNTQDQQLLAAINAPQAQRDQLAKQNQQVFQGGAAGLQFSGGQIPANQMSQDEAARLAFARALPGIAQATGQENLRQYLQKAQAQQFDTANKRADVTAQIPKLRLDYQASQAAASAKNQQLNLERQALGLKTTNQTFQQGIATNRAMNENATVLSNLYGKDAQGNLTLAGRRAILQEQKAHRSAAKGGYTAAGAQKVKQNAAKMADLFYYGKPPTTFTKADGSTSSKNDGIPAVTNYQQALKQMLAAGIPLSWAQTALDTHWKPGTYNFGGGTYSGRPQVSYQGRQGLAKAGMPMKNPYANPTNLQKTWLVKHGLG